MNDENDMDTGEEYCEPPKIYSNPQQPTHSHPDKWIPQPSEHIFLGIDYSKDRHYTHLFSFISYFLIASESVDPSDLQELVTEEPKNDPTLGTKGADGDIILLDEAAYTKPRLVFETILPMLGMKDAVFLALSTPLGTDNWLSQAITIKDENGNPYFPAIQVGLICDQCAATGQMEIIEQCQHRRGITPPWKSEDRESKMRKVISILDDPGRAFRENAALIIDSGESSFDQKLLRNWFESPPYILTEYVPDKIYITIDPDAGGGNSQCAIVSGYRLEHQIDDFPRQTLVITGIESTSTKTHIEQQSLLILHIQKLRANPRFAYVPIILIPEIGTGFNHTVLDHAALSQYLCYSIHQNNGPIPGVRKDQYLTQEYVLSTVDIINDLRFVLEKDWVTVYGHNGKKNSETLLGELQSQLCRYGKDASGKLSGKMGGQFHDDLSIAFMMLVYWSRCLEQPTRSTNPYFDWIQTIYDMQAQIKNMTSDDMGALRDGLAATNSFGFNSPAAKNAVLDQLGLKPLSNNNRNIYMGSSGGELASSRAFTRKRTFSST